MGFFKGVFSLSIIYALVWAIYHFGYMMGVESEKDSLYHANNLIQRCNKIVSGRVDENIKLYK